MEDSSGVWAHPAQDGLGSVRQTVLVAIYSSSYPIDGIATRDCAIYKYSGLRVCGNPLPIDNPEVKVDFPPEAIWEPLSIQLHSKHIIGTVIDGKLC